MIRTLITALLLMSASMLAAAEPAPMQVGVFQLVFFRRGPTWTPEVTPATEKLQKEHQQFQQKMIDQHKAWAAGPFEHQKDETVRGMTLYHVDTLEEAQKLASDDPAVKAGRLVLEVVTWYVPGGNLKPKKAP